MLLGHCSWWVGMGGFCLAETEVRLGVEVGGYLTANLWEHKVSVLEWQKIVFMFRVSECRECTGNAAKLQQIVKKKYFVTGDVTVFRSVCVYLDYCDSQTDKHKPNTWGRMLMLG
jgi:hypothetical protein